MSKTDGMTKTEIAEATIPGEGYWVESARRSLVALMEDEKLQHPSAPLANEEAAGTAS